MKKIWTWGGALYLSERWWEVLRRVDNKTRGEDQPATCLHEFLSLILQFKAVMSVSTGLASLHRYDEAEDFR